MSGGIMRLVRDFNQISYAARTLERIQHERATKYGVKVTHSGLGRSKVIRGPSKEYVEVEGRRQLALWDANWQRQQESADKRSRRDAELRSAEQIREAERRSAKQRAEYIAEQKKEAERRTSAAVAEIAVAEVILLEHIHFLGKLDWDSLKPNPEPPFSRPTPHSFPPLPSRPTVSAEPSRHDSRYELATLVKENRIQSPPSEPTPQAVGFIGKLFGGQRKAELEYQRLREICNKEYQKYRDGVPLLIEDIFIAEHNAWTHEAEEATEKHKALIRKRTEDEERQTHDLEDWNRKSQEWSNGLVGLERKINGCRESYANSDPIAVADYFSVMLASSKRPPWISPDWTMMYDGESHLLDVSYQLPKFDDVPSTIGYSYVPLEDCFTDIKAKKTQRDDLYDSVVYQLSLRCIHDIFKSDVESVLFGIRFIGHIHAVNKATGIEEEMNILSVTCMKEYFENLDLAKVDPATCFLSLQNATPTKPHLLKSITPPKYLSNSENQHSCALRYGTGDLTELVAYSSETSRARILSNDKKNKWEWELSAELIRSKLKHFSPKNKSGSNYSVSTEPMLANRFLDLISHRVEQIQEIINQIAEVFNDELIQSSGARGSPGDSLLILETVNHFMFQIADISRIESEVLCVRALPELTGVRNSFAGVTQNIVRQCLFIADEIDRIASGDNDSTDGPIQLKISLSLEEFISQVGQEVQKCTSQLRT